MPKVIEISEVENGYILYIRTVDKGTIVKSTRILIFGQGNDEFDDMLKLITKEFYGEDI